MEFFTDPLRVTLLVAGVIVLIAIYLYGRRPKLKKSSLSPENTATHPSEYQALNDAGSSVGTVKLINDISDADVEEKILIKDESGDFDQSREQAKFKSNEKNVNEQTEVKSEKIADDLPKRIIVIHLKADTKRPYQGAILTSSFKEAGLEFGSHKIFHYYGKDDEKLNPLFSLASMIEPGIFDLDEMGNFKTTGLTFFMQLPLKHGDSSAAFTQMMSTAQRLAKKLGGELLNEDHRPLTLAAMNKLRKEVDEIEVMTSS